MPQSDDKDRLDKRDWEMWRSYVKGATQREIAQQHKISQSAVSQRLKAVREAIPEEDRAQVLRRHLDSISAMTSELWQLVDSEPAPAYSNGRRMTMPGVDDPDEPGEQVWDHSGRLAAMDRLTKMLEREAKLLGIDSAEKVDVSAVVEHKPAEVLDLINRARQQTEEDEARLREGPA